MKRIKTVYFIFCFTCLYACFLENKEDTREVFFATENPEKTLISITNQSSSVSKFSFSLNDRFYSTMDDVEDAIIQRAGRDNDSLFYYAWQFVCENTYYNMSLSKEDWFTSPLLYINSLGFGLCGKQAIVLSEIWKKLGYETRIWGLNGHIVPEVMYKNKWLMLDPGYKLYYLNTNKDIANIDELTHNKEFFNNAVCFNNVQSCLVLYDSVHISKYYTTKEDNQLIYDDITFAPVKKCEVFLPPNSVFEFPGVFTDNALTMDSSTIPYYANAILKIPPTWEGNIKNTLVLADIKGNGRVRIDNVEYTIGQSELQKKLSQQLSFIEDINILKHTDTISLIYYLNPVFSALEKNNKLLIKASNINQLNIFFKELEDAETLNKHLLKQYFFYDEHRLKLLKKNIHMPDTCSFSKCSFHTDDDIIRTYKYFCDCMQFDYRVRDSVADNISSILHDLPDTYNKKKIYNLLNCMPAELIFYDMSYATQKQIAITIGKLTKTN